MKPQPRESARPSRMRSVMPEGGRLLMDLRHVALNHAVHLASVRGAEETADQIVEAATTFTEFLEPPRVAATGEEVKL